MWQRDYFVRKVRASQDRIAANGSRRRLQGKCNREIPPRFSAVRVERRGKSSPPVQETGRACKPYPMQRRAHESACPAVISAKGGTEHVRQRHAKIDCHTRQNPAYRFARYVKSSAPLNAGLFYYHKGFSLLFEI